MAFDIFFDPQEYFAISLLSVLLFSWSNLYLIDKSLGNVILFLVCCNFLLSSIYISFSYTCQFFFGIKSTRQYQMKVFELIISFLMSKIVIFELASQESIMDGWHWALWLIVLAWAKGLTYQANFYVYYISQCGERNALQYFLSFFHIVPVILCTFCTITMANVWTENSPSNRLKILLWYDVLFLMVESGQVLCKFALQLGDAIQSISSTTSAIQSVLEICCELVLTSLSLLHLLHIVTINGISITLVGVVTIVNLYSVFTKLFKQVYHLREFFLIKRKISALFPTIVLKDIIDSQNLICPICLQECQTNTVMKKLPCSHGIHENCLRTLLQYQSFLISFEELRSISQPELVESLSGARIFRCPICRQRINADTAELVNIPPRQGHCESDNSPEISLIHNSDVLEPRIQPNTQMISRISIWNILEITLLNFGGARLHRPNIMPMRSQHQRNLQNEADSILEMFPQFPRDMILRDLSRTSSPAETIDNIISGRIQVFREPSDSRST